VVTTLATTPILNWLQRSGRQELLAEHAPR
jgi:hypothetical protein